MTEIERKERAIRKAEALRKAHMLFNEIRDEDGGKRGRYDYYLDALIRSIEQHEAFRREVSDMVNDMVQHVERKSITKKLRRFICLLLGHRYNCSILEEVNGQLWATKEQCARCGDVVPNTYYRVARLQWDKRND